MMPFGTLTNNLAFVLGESDFVSVHLPLTRETRGLLDGPALSNLRPSAYLINTSSAGIVDERALVRALAGGRIAGAALDALALDLPGAGNALLEMGNVMVTPYAAFYSDEALQEVAREAARQTVEVLYGQLPRNIVNREVFDRPNFRLGLVQAQRRSAPRVYAQNQ
jgi:D-3-phosphoglycerate dehydrogenase